MSIMVMTAVTILLVLTLVPLFSHIIWLFIKMVKHEHSTLTGPAINSREPVKIISQRKRTYLIIIIYILTVLAVCIWTLAQLISSTDITQQGMIAAAIFISVSFLIFIISIFMWVKYAFHANPLPPADADDRTISEWHNKYSDLLSRNQWRMMIILVAVIFIICILFGETASLL